MAGLTAGSPFPGDSLTRFWKNPSPASGGVPPASLSELVPNDPKNRNYWGLPAPLPPRASLKDSEWSYMRREVEVGEQLYHLTEDAREQHNLAQDPSVQDTLRRLREPRPMDRRPSAPEPVPPLTATRLGAASPAKRGGVITRPTNPATVKPIKRRVSQDFD